MLARVLLVSVAKTDLLKIHWPVSFRRINDTERFPIDEETFGMQIVDVPLIETWKAMEALVKKGKLKTIGVSNFSVAKIEEIWDAAEIKPAVNQVELHPYFAQPELVKWCQDKVRYKFAHQEVVVLLTLSPGDRSPSLQPTGQQHLRSSNVSDDFSGARWVIKDRGESGQLMLKQGHRGSSCG